MMKKLKSIVTGEDLAFEFIKFEQPAGEMYMGVLVASEIFQISKVNRISEKYKNEESELSRLTQRDLKENRIAEISSYAESNDVIFPTPIILSGNSDFVIQDGNKFYFKESAKEHFSIIDGQHRLYGIMKSRKKDELVLPCILIFDTEPYEDALIFITINGKQVRVPSSIIYELFEISPNRSEEKTLHNLAKTFNNDEQSPFVNSIKMLGYKMDNQEFAPITQSSFVTPLRDLITKNTLFKNLFSSEQDDVIYKILYNYFSAIREIFVNDWGKKESILQKSVGFKALIIFLDKVLIPEAQKSRDFSKEFFVSKLKKVHNNIKTPITSQDYGSSYGGAKKISDAFKQALEDN
ncbi:DGQHR domain-containing protein [Streptococcus himalayensis]|uniref:DGQHR domain-containing protein n=1 Tax=Streptococcus himalayensis TaxID=1888195 RepID=A0A917A8M7_9STRE|nr:DGQHR domain-containing protein [Streptococcus himalayensis]GGE34430.1 DGQHR domain-containing protein [Streptococcus himalayensis]